MRWHIPKLGDRRTVRRFLWLPVTIGPEKRWLERASITQEYQRVRVWVPGECSSFIAYEWVNVTWAGSERKVAA